MMRKLILALAILAVAAVPAYARERGREFHGDRGRFEHREHFNRFRGFYAPYFGYAYAPSCGWQGGYWVNQPYVDAYGNYTYVPQWVPAQWVCY